VPVDQRKQKAKTHARRQTEPAGRISQPRPKTKVPVTVFLINGVKLAGRHHLVRQFLRAPAPGWAVQLVYKHAISTIMPSQPINLYEGDD
jgi:host factor-I protein